jgi:lipopolysaccharide transport system ATP-binding protein
MPQAIIQLDNISKSYAKYASGWHRAANWFGASIAPREQAQVLTNISFSVAKGEAIGIVGQNGAGKSTLLKVITGTLRATSGSLHVHGRIAAILELGMGFNHELTGRENVYHAAGLMGFKRIEIENLIDSISEFSELGEYFDQPLRVYSSGMQMRLAFSLATASRPEVLIIDEALSVGDTYFQHKSFARIKEYREQGTTLLFVSHDKAAVLNLCNRAVLLDKGQVLKDGYPESIMDFYNALIADKEHGKIEVQQHKSGKVQTISGTGEAKVSSIGLYDKDGKAQEVINVGQEVELRVVVDVHADIDELVLGYMIKDRLGQEIFGTNTCYTKQVIQDAKSGSRVEFKISFAANLGVGSYAVTTGLSSTDSHIEKNYQWQDMALVFDVANINRETFIGCNWMKSDIRINNF